MTAMYFACRGISPSKFLELDLVAQVFMYESMCREIKAENDRLILMFEVLQKIARR